MSNTIILFTTTFTKTQRSSCVQNMVRTTYGFMTGFIIIIATCIKNQRCSLKSNIVLLTACQLYYFALYLYNSSYIYIYICIYNMYIPCKCIYHVNTFLIAGSLNNVRIVKIAIFNYSSKPKIIICHKCYTSKEKLFMKNVED